ncbi:RNA polymerase sigma factor [Streptomyces xanthochromogenes]|uniref:RNA polymerase sigma factor n=1 Tax=Streptomyces xanthochromogenes TaxID=67384 RepID=UPI0037FF5376
MSEEGDKEKYDNEVIELYRVNSKAMLGSLVRRGIPRPVAEEYVNDAFVATRRAWGRIRSGKPLAYAYEVVNNLCAKYWAVVANAPEDPWPDTDPPDTRDDYREIIDSLTVKGALESLPTRLQEVIELRFMKELSVRETAQELGLSEGAIKRYTSDAIKKLKPQLSSRDAEGGRGER